MPPRSAKKSSAKKRSAMAKNSASASEFSPADASTLVADETTPEPEALSTPRDKDASEADAESGDALAEGKTSPSPAMVEEPADPIGEDSISPSKPEEPLEDADAELEGEEASDAVAKMEVEEGVKDTFDKVNTIDKVEYEDTGADDAEDVDGDDHYTSDADVENVENDDNDHTLDMQAALAEGKSQKGPQIFVGGLDKGAVEDDLIKVFGVFGEVQNARIVRNPTTKKSKGFAFIRFANSEHTMKALAELKDGTEINGKHVRIQASQDNATLYLGNISKTWTRDNVIERLKSLGVEQFDNMILPKDTMNEEKIKGFAFLEFNCHSDAILAFQRLRKPDADFGRDRTVKVAFAHASLHPSEDDLLQVKTVHFDGIPLSWDEEKVKEICKEYGQIERVRLARNFSSRKRKDFGFVEFSSRESALACVEGINKAQIVDGDAKVVANLAKPVNKGRLAKQGSKGGFKAKNGRETIQEAGGIVKKRKAPEEILQEEKHNPKIAKLSKPSTSQKRDSKGKSGLQVTKSIRRKKNSGKVIDSDVSGRSSKKMRGNRKRTYSAIREASYGARTSAYPARYAVPSDLVPHAGYLPAQQGTSTHAYDQRRSGTYNSELRNNFGSGRAISGAPTSYHSDYSIYQGAGYRHHSSGAYAPRGPYYY
ncbi:hypothetical protein M5K25_017408 [Dendrobium thyrsiflorum]|uniref:RRM domain-containing protein n=1 Tax=Dendrobium thyrsiflorum TaxID=117978 RepID=A0ABD0UUJ1_DENTH